MSLAELQSAAVVSTQQNLITSWLSEDRPDLRGMFRFGQFDRIFIYTWVNTPRPEPVRLTVKSGEREVSLTRNWVAKTNPLLGECVGYRLWTWKGANALGSGEHELLLYNRGGRLICRRDFSVAAGSE